MKALGIMAAALLVGAAPEAPEAPPLPGFLSGTWSEQKGQAWTEESWLPPRGGIMIGVARSGSGERLRNWEVMRIAPNAAGKPVYWAAPGGREATGFEMVSMSEHEVVFANPTHDYPQRIRYWREGGELHAEIALIDGSRANRWTYQRR
jgi:hypothetical protein